VIRNGTGTDLAAIGELLGRANDSPYDIRAVAEEKVFGAGFSGPPRVRVFEDGGAIRGVAVSCGKYLRILGVDRQYRRRGIGSELLRDSSATVIAAEAGNYFTPGVVESDSATIALLRRLGYRESAATWNMHVEIGDWRLEIGRT
jgi:ribosomal protein S18 acetylase RimI-like enzyme